MPPYGIEVIGYNPVWVDEDVNPDGSRMCFVNDDETWVNVRWCGYHDAYEEQDSNDPVECRAPEPFSPTHFQYKPEPPKPSSND